MAAEVRGLLYELHRHGATIVVVTHNAEMARRAEREVRIVDGSIVRHPLLDQDVRRGAANDAKDTKG